MSEATLFAGFEERVLDLAAGRMRYVVGGAGPALVLLHGLGGAATNWAEMAPLLARRHRVLVPDLPGHGYSDPLPAGAGLGTFAERVALVAEREELAAATVAGHSFGGLVALRLALARPGLVGALALAAPAGISSASLRNRLGLAVTTRLRPARRVARHRRGIAASQSLARAAFFGLAADGRDLSPEAILGFLEGAALATDTRTAARAMLAWDPRPELDRVGCPVLLLWGARDRVLPVEDGFEYARRLRAPLRVLPGTGHLLIGERPAECVRLLGAFLETAPVPLRDSSAGVPRRFRLPAPRGR